MSQFKKLASILVAGVLVQAALAQVSGETYRLQPEDVLIIAVYQLPEISAIVPVGPDGNISAPFLGTVKAGGKTIKELEADLTAAYVDRLKLNDPIVSVTIREYRRVKASVGGFVGRPGVYDMRPGDRLLDLVNAGGGTSTNGRADLSKAYLVKKNSQERIPIDLRALLNGDSSQNYVVDDGDNLIVPEQNDNRVIVAGRVQRAGPVDYRENMTLTEVVEQAGQIPRKSRLSRVQVFRPLPGRPGDFLAIEADLVAFAGGKSAADNIVMRPGDLVFVPDSGNVDFEMINSIANVFFIFDRFGFSPFRSRN
ncbi:MAG: polysaccharide export protein [Fimbriimonadaceae bacterium]|nr:polysaccharide export protein [Fimbriimonadaceae bacterium]